jgi:PAS domain-containing protein
VFQDIERENQLILRAAGEGIYGVNAEGKTTFVNPGRRTHAGLGAEELVGKESTRSFITPIMTGRHYPDR